jgi:hypothetical protein
MRLGEIKQILDYATDENYLLTVDSAPIYGGLAYVINNFFEFTNAYDIINDLSWNDADNTQIAPIVEKYRGDQNQIQIEQTEFTILNAYVTEVNQKLPYFCSILKTMVNDQDEKVINIKLPGEIDSFADLNSINTRLEDTLKLFNVDGKFKFLGFDVGTQWYEIAFIGGLTYQYFVGCLDVATKYFESKKAYYDSKKAELDYKASLNKQDEFTDDGLKKYTERRLNLMIEDRIEVLLNKIGSTNGATPAELQSKLIKATTSLVKELGTGTEFHLSLNPPEYAFESNGKLTIDYKKIQELRAEEAKQLEAQKPKTLPEPKEPSKEPEK